MKMVKRMALMLLLIGGLFAGLVAYQQFVAEMMKGALALNANPPATVTAMVLEPQRWQPQLRSIGSLRAVQGVTLRAEVSGVVEAIHFSSGQAVKQGQLLLEFDSSAEQAQLQALQASRELAEINLRRDRQQFEVHAISQAQLDVAESELKRHRAQEAQQQALINKRRIRAPFDGRIGISPVEIGQLLSPGEVIASLQNRERLYVDFNIPQQYLPLLHPGQPIHLQANIDSAMQGVGTIHAIHSEVDRETRNVRVEGVVENRDGVWVPGMFVHLKIDKGEEQNYLTLPQTAVSYNAYGATLFLVKPGEESDALPVAQQVFVETGERRGDQVAILSGVKQGDQVVTSGQMKLKNGTPLIIDNSVEPANEVAPHPQER